MLMRKIYNIFLRADYTGRSFRLEAKPDLTNYIIVTWIDTSESEKILATKGCYFRNLNRVGGYEIKYYPDTKTVTPALTLEVTGTAGDLYYLIISGQGRIRISDTPPV